MLSLYDCSHINNEMKLWKDGIYFLEFNSLVFLIVAFIYFNISCVVNQWTEY